MKFKEAIQYSLSRNVVLPTDYYSKLAADQRARSISIAGLSELSHIEFVVDELNKTLASGGTLADFKTAVRSGSIKIDLPDYRLENIYRSNIQTAYNRGRWEQQFANRSDRPYLVYDALDDTRTRVSHKALDGFIRPVTDPVWQVLYTPNGYNCRCSIRAVTESVWRSMGGNSLGTFDVTPDKGWFNSPLNYTETTYNLINNWESKSTNGVTVKAVSDAKNLIRSEIINQPAVIENWINNPNVVDKFKSDFSKYANVPGLTVEEFSAIKHYTSSGSPLVNETLRGIGEYSIGESLTAIQSTVILSNALSKLPSYSGPVIRKIPFVANIASSYPVNTIVTENTFLSTSIGTINARERMPITFHIISKSGKKISNISTDKTESEVLFDRATKFLVLKVTEIGNETDIYLEEI